MLQVDFVRLSYAESSIFKMILEIILTRFDEFIMLPVIGPLSNFP